VGVVTASDDSHTSGNHTYGGLSTNDPLIVQDIGNGFSFVSTDATGKVNGAFLVMTMY
jgi:hypothetical protein